MHCSYMKFVAGAAGTGTSGTATCQERAPDDTATTIGLASDDVTKHSNAWQRGNLVLNKGSAPYKSMLGESLSLGEALYFFVERFEWF